MQFELTKEFVVEVKGLLAAADEKHLELLFADLHPADIAEVIDELELDEAKLLYKTLEAEKASEVIVYLEEEVREKFLSSLSAKEIAEQFIDNLESDDAADIIAQLPVDVREEVISLIDDVDQASHIIDLMNFEEGTAGALMGKELVQVREDLTVSEAVREVRNQSELLDSIYTVYVVDHRNILLGTIPVKKLLFNHESTLISHIYNPEIIMVKTNTESEEVANIMKKYDLVVLPVVDELKRLVGRITIDDIVDVIQEEADKDYQMASGLSESVESTDTVFQLTRARLPWLLVGLSGGILSSRIITVYEHQIQIYPEMAFFMPLIAAMGGNVGVQSSAIIVQGLANDTLGFDGIFQKLTKEFTVALVNGVALSGLLLAYNLIIASSLNLTLTVSAALLSVIIFAALFGTIVPLMLDKYKIDPALATGPFITTMNDICGLIIYFTVGYFLYS